jgi:hypothetical protein
MTWVFKLFILLLSVSTLMTIGCDIHSYQAERIYVISDEELDEIERDTGLDLRETIIVGD